MTDRARPPELRAVLTDPAHLLSLARLPLAALVWWRPADNAFVLALLGAALVTDVLDGRIGRRRHADARGLAHVGSWLDPLCDKAFMASAAAAVVISRGLPLHLVALVLWRDAATLVLALVFRVFAGRARFGAHDFRARVSGKLTTGVQGLALVCALFWPGMLFAAAMGAALVGTVAVIERVVLALRVQRQEVHA